MQRITLHIILLLFICAKTNAQEAFTNNGNLQVHTGANVSGFGNFTNASTAILINNGNVYLKGNISNSEASMATGSGTLTINGTGAQAVNGTQSFKTFNLVSNNAAGITLNNNLSVSGAHTFTSGIITTSATPNYMVYEAGSSYSGDADVRHVNGWVKKIGSTNFIFPVGNGTVERTVAINSLSVSSEFNARYLANTPNATQMQLPLRTIDINEYWPITKVSGGTATVTMNWDRSKVYFPNYIVADIVAAGYNGSLWVSNGGTASGNPATTGTITSNSMSSFNLFTFGSISWVLPLTLIDFTASRKNNYTNIEWHTEKEYNTDHFIVERSDDGSTFYAIARVSGRNSGKTEQYSTRDNATIRNIAYYRLRSADTQGKETLSRIVAVTDSKAGNKLVLLTNPIRTKVILIATGKLTGEFDYEISMINGQLVQKGDLSILSNGQYEILLNGKFQPGTYSLKVMNSRQSFYFKLLIL